MIYLDNNATTRPTAAAAAAMDAGARELWANPSSVHRLGQEARARVELARRALADLVGARPRQLTLTGSGTESIDLAIRGVLAAGRRKADARAVLVTTRVEHAAVRDLAQWLQEREGVEVRWLPIDADGVVDDAAAPDIIGDDATIVSLQWVNNETGVIQPVRAVGRLCRRRAVPFHCDGTQWVGKMPTAMRDDGGADDAGEGGGWCDLLTLSPHKFHGPKGVGVLWARPGVRFAPTLHGSQEQGRRAGTENVPGILGAGEAAREALTWLADDAERTRLASLRDAFEAEVLRRVPDAAVNGRRLPGTARLWNTTNIAFPRLEAEALLLMLSERGVCASAGAACSSGSLDPSPVLLAMGVPPEEAHGSVRFSLSRESTAPELQNAAAIVAECVARLRGSLPA